MNPYFEWIEIRKETASTYYGCFRLGPLTIGQGITFSNTLRRVLFSNLQGVAITAVRFKNESIHEFSILPGVRDSVLEILFNLAQIYFHQEFPFEIPQIGSLNITGSGKVYAKDIKISDNIVIINPNQYITEIISERTSLELDFMIQHGKGYISKSQLYAFKNTGGCIIPIDTSFSPIKRVNYRIEDYLNSIKDEDNSSNTPNQHYQVNTLQKERILFEIWTSRGLHPTTALKLGLEETLKLFFGIQKIINQDKKTRVSFFNEIKNKLEKTKIHTFSISTFKNFINILKKDCIYHKLSSLQKKQLSQIIISKLRHSSFLTNQKLGKAKKSRPQIIIFRTQKLDTNKIQINNLINNIFFINLNINQHLQIAGINSPNQILSFSQRKFLKTNRIGVKSANLIQSSLLSQLGYLNRKLD
jgi:DNA-directed RNA polymerase subunit alpha